MPEGLAGRSIIAADDLSLEDIEAVFRTADDIQQDRRSYFGKAAGLLAATLFFEPSTRTRLSFEAAMQRMGGGVISAWDVNASSTVKGESLADTARVVSGYADVLVVRHPWDGAAKLAAEYASVPVINAGDGSHEHPSQTLCDLYTLRGYHGTLKGLKVALCGDLLHGRTTHSLAFALARFGANVIFVPGDGNEIPGYVLRRLERDYHAQIRREELGVLSALFDDGGAMGQASSTVDAIYMTPSEPHQLAMTSIEGTTVEFRVGSGEALSIYVTRRQKERGTTADTGGYPTVNARTLRASQFNNISILHPLPRVGELDPEVDGDPRSLYFQQAAMGIPIRMALLWHVLGVGKDGPPAEKVQYRPGTRGLGYAGEGFECGNRMCATNQEPQFARHQFEIVLDKGYRLRCLYCDQESAVELAGNTESRYYYPPELLDRFLPSVRPEHVRFFRSAQDAEAAGFKKASEKWDSYQPRDDGKRKQWLDSVADQPK